MKGLFLVIQVILVNYGHSLDQREYQATIKEKPAERSIYQIDINRFFDKRTILRIDSPYYQIDLNGDDVSEQIRYSFVDGHLQFEIYDIESKLLHQQLIRVEGARGTIYRVRKLQLNKDWIGLALFVYDGLTGSVNKKGTSSLVLIAADSRLKQFYSTRTGKIWYEHRNVPDQYQKREYQVYSKDLNNDHIREIIYSDGKNKYVYHFHQATKRWLKI
jgi:hypothetical protein